MANTVEAKAITFSPEALAFAAEHGIAAELQAVVQLTHRIFPNSPVRAVVDDDPEVADDRHILLEVDADTLAVPQALEARFQWHRELFACCPAPLVCHFRLALELQS